MLEGQRTREVADMQLEYLERLGEELARRGMRVWLALPPGRVPNLQVVNPEARALEEHVYAGCGSDGSWWFWWSWAERIARTEDLETAAATVARALIARGDDPPEPPVSFPGLGSDTPDAHPGRRPGFAAG